MKDLVNVQFPDATCTRLIQDKLNTHNPSFLYEVFEPDEASFVREIGTWEDKRNLPG